MLLHALLILAGTIAGHLGLDLPTALRLVETDLGPAIFIDPAGAAWTVLALLIVSALTHGGRALKRALIWNGSFGIPDPEAD